ncbi:MAG: hypothetical protein S4CHLAM45_03510 [Chlamydiales bacterium]|nr:hypothetical protein [Chlamydiales bacterium]MCH9622468.1 hypothetical protein [Chlamydiales bacterium]
MGVFAATVAALVTAPFGVAIRAFLGAVQNRPFLHARGRVEEKEEVLSGATTLFSWNICCVPAGYAITDGGVAPWSFRIAGLVKKIQDQKADVVSLYEVFDIQTAHALIEGLGEEYSHFYYNMGSKAVGPSSGLFVASKFEVKDPEFTLFPQDALDGRAKNCGKGVFGFTASGIRFHVTHLQHSEIPAQPTAREKEARRKEMEIIAQKVKACTLPVIITGDLNMDHNELTNQSGDFTMGKLQSGRTWGGDQWCANLTGKPISTPCTLDYTLTQADGPLKLDTSFIQASYVNGVFNPSALSDHKGLRTKIQKTNGKKT